ncbi:MAG: plasma-membrane proton-efflux P-type ATPase [Thermofilum sp.]|jgi:H+-transporting ATPase|nr:plasma-membrane proton-efflux P-type ATPase [Thermofilum sp.]
MESKNTKLGLTTEEARRLLSIYGPNEIPFERPSRVKILLSKFWGIVPWMLELTIALNILLRRWVEAAIVVVWLLFSALVAFQREDKAQKALLLLRQRLTINAYVLRDGAWRAIPANELVPGDYVHLSGGDIVPADVEIVSGQILVDQSQLTGESRSVEKKAGDVAYAGSLVVEGEAYGVVKATGTKTYYGRTAELLKLAKTPSQFDIVVTKVTKYVGIFNGVLALIVLLYTIIQGQPILGVLVYFLLLLVMSLPVAAPVMFTMSTSIGSQMLASNGVLVTRLSAVEDAAAMDVLCMDKTGTLTENRLAVEKILPLGDMDIEKLIEFAALATNEAAKSMVDKAIIEFAAKNGVKIDYSKRLDYKPFDPKLKYSEAIVADNGNKYHILLGEPSTIARATNTPIEELDKKISEAQTVGSRVLAVAIGKTLTTPKIMGLIILTDPLRKDAKELVAKLKENGIKLIMATGDHESTARAIALQAGIGEKVAPRGIVKEGIDPEEIMKYDVFAGVYPEEKYVLVKELQKAGHVVGMTGDGVNDAPALKQANVGIAVANSTDVAKTAASLVLTQPGLKPILSAVRISRVIYQRMKNWFLTFFVRKFGLPTFITLGVLVFNKFLLNSLLMALLMFIGEVSAFALSTDNVVPSSKPDKLNLRKLAILGFTLAMLLLLFNISAYWVATNIFHFSDPETQTLIFVWLVLSGGFATLYVTRTPRHFWEKPYPGKMLLGTTFLTILATIVLAVEGWLMAPITLNIIMTLLLLTLAYLFLADFVKVSMLQE